MRNGVYGILSQVTFSGANFAVALGALHALPLEDVSSIAFVQTSLLFLTTIVNSLVCVPFALTVRADKSSSRRRGEATSFYIQSWSVATGVSLFFACITFALSDMKLSSAIYATVYCLLFQFRNAQRNILISKHEALQSALLEFFGFASLAVLLIYIVFFHIKTDIGQFLNILSITSLLPIIVGQILDKSTRVKFRRSSLMLMTQNFKRIGLQSLLGTVPSEIVVNAHIYVLTILGDKLLLAAIYSASILFRHITIIYAGLRNVLLPDIIRRLRENVRYTKRYVFAVSAFLFVAPLLNAFLFLLVPKSLIVFALGEHGNGMTPYWPLAWGVIYALVGVRVPYFCFQQASKQFSAMTQVVFLSSLLSAGLYLVYLLYPSIAVLTCAMLLPQLAYSVGLAALTIGSPLAGKQI